MFTSNTSNVYILWKEEVKEPHAAIASFFFSFFSFLPNKLFSKSYVCRWQEQRKIISTKNNQTSSGSWMLMLYWLLNSAKSLL